MLKIRELSDVIDMALSIKYDEHVYYNRKTHQIHIEYEDGSELLDEDYEFREIDPDLLEVEIEPFGRDLFLDFFATVEHQKVRQMMFDQFHGSGKYRKVKNLFPRYHLQEKFYKFKDEYHLKIAQEWCKLHEVNYIDIDGEKVVFSK
ncbi:MAG: hypothetical protein JEZ05_09075 [Tenericutes bacterium]|nr:hypothetical protein [Mycoplasmatota bacterium]